MRCKRERHVAAHWLVSQGGGGRWSGDGSDVMALAGTVWYVDISTYLESRYKLY